MIQKVPDVLSIPVKEARVPRLNRIFDCLLSGLGLLVSTPFWALIAPGVKLEDGGPVLYAQERVGKGGRRFRSWKFRSMIPDADHKYGRLQAGENDERLTRVGRLLRATAMDELPQLWNIFKGDMSFVGPRAPAPEEIEIGNWKKGKSFQVQSLKCEAQGSEADEPGSRLGVQRSKFNVQGSMSNKPVPLQRIPRYEERHGVRPGLTGLAQIYAPWDVPRRHKYKSSLLYFIKKQTFWLELKLIALSFWITVQTR